MASHSKLLDGLLIGFVGLVAAGMLIGFVATNEHEYAFRWYLAILWSVCAVGFPFVAWKAARDKVLAFAFAVLGFCLALFYWLRALLYDTPTWFLWVLSFASFIALVWIIVWMWRRNLLSFYPRESA